MKLKEYEKSGTDQRWAHIAYRKCRLFEGEHSLINQYDELKQNFNRVFIETVMTKYQ